MSSFMRAESIAFKLETKPREVSFPRHMESKAERKPILLSSLYGSRVFSVTEMQQYLPKPIFNVLRESLNANKMLDKHVADAVAHAVKGWAMSHGATHYTHWFQPQTNATAEKHDSFLNLKVSTDGTEVHHPTEAFLGHGPGPVHEGSLASLSRSSSSKSPACRCRP